MLGLKGRDTARPFGYKTSMETKFSILVVDRFKRPLETWKRVSELVDGGEVKVVSEPDSAESELSSGRYDLILCSYRLSTESGTEFIARMRARGIETPVIFLSITMDTKGVVETAGIPMADFLAAPFSSEELRQRIRLLCSKPAPL